MYFNHECESNLKNINMKNLFTALLVCLLYLPNFLNGQNLAKTESRLIFIQSVKTDFRYETQNSF